MRLLLLAAFAAAAPAATLYELPAVAKHKGKVALVVNTASKCGYTKQYKQLQEVHDKYRERGFTVLGFPSNDFMGQEPGTDPEIKKFYELNYGVTFPLYPKAPVKGEKTQPVFAFLKQKTGGEELSWNFNKFLVGRDGVVAARYGSKVKPDAPEILAKIEELLAKKP